MQYYSSTLEHLSDLSAATDHRGTPLVTTYSRDEPQVCFTSGISMSSGALSTHDSTVQHLQDLGAAIDHSGTPLATTYSRDEPQVC